MFHRPKKVKIFLKDSLVTPVKLVLAAFGCYHAKLIYTYWETGVYITKHNTAFSIEEDPFTYFTALISSLLFVAVTIYFIVYGIRKKSTE